MNDAVKNDEKEGAFQQERSTVRRPVIPLLADRVRVDTEYRT